MTANHLPGNPLPLPLPLRLSLRRLGVVPGRQLLTVSVARQSMHLWERCWPGRSGSSAPNQFSMRRCYRVSTSKFGIGQKVNSFKTPLGLHAIAAKVGAGHPIGTVFKERIPVGFLWNGIPQATICHRILWLEGLEPGLNRGGEIDTFARYIYIHGFSDESTLGRPQSHGCIHVAAADLLPLFDRLPVGTLVWIGDR